MGYANDLITYGKDQAENNAGEKDGANSTAVDKIAHNLGGGGAGETPYDKGFNNGVSQQSDDDDDD
jgi:hypothetical protein